MQCCLIPSWLGEIALCLWVKKLVQQGPQDWWGFCGFAEHRGDAAEAPEDPSDRVAWKSSL